MTLGRRVSVRTALRLFTRLHALSGAHHGVVEGGEGRVRAMMRL